MPNGNVLRSTAPNILKHAPATTNVHATMSDLDSTLKARGNTHGDFSTNSRTSQDLKQIMRLTPNWARLSVWQQECLDMTCHKMGRIGAGDFDELDHWRDIAGYNMLVADRLKPLDDPFDDTPEEHAAMCADNKVYGCLVTLTPPEPNPDRFVERCLLLLIAAVVIAILIAQIYANSRPTPPVTTLTPPDINLMQELKGRWLPIGPNTFEFLPDDAPSLLSDPANN